MVEEYKKTFNYNLTK